MLCVFRVTGMGRVVCMLIVCGMLRVLAVRHVLLGGMRLVPHMRIRPGLLVHRVLCVLAVLLISRGPRLLRPVSAYSMVVFRIGHLQQSFYR